MITTFNEAIEQTYVAYLLGTDSKPELGAFLNVLDFYESYGELNVNFKMGKKKDYANIFRQTADMAFDFWKKDKNVYRISFYIEDVKEVLKGFDIKNITNPIDYLIEETIRLYDEKFANLKISA
ncbi:MAG: hypothetical protein AAGL34_13860 [Bacteroidota bacterium]